MRETVDALLATLLAGPCVVCGRVSEQPTRGAACPDCWAAIRFITPPCCRWCGEPLPSARTVPPGPVPALVCAACAAQPPIVDTARALGPYEGALRGIVHGLKYHGRRSLAPPLGTLLRARCGTVLRGADAVVPVPLHRRREWSRGFNQADAIACALGLPVWRPLRRTRHTSPQSTLAAAERRANVRGAFALRRRLWNKQGHSRLQGTRLVLVDDVSTTGATLDECARVLKAAGVAQVRALTVARAVLGQRHRPATPRAGDAPPKAITSARDGR